MSNQNSTNDQLLNISRIFGYYLMPISGGMGCILNTYCACIVYKIMKRKSDLNHNSRFYRLILSKAIVEALMGLVGIGW